MTLTCLLKTGMTEREWELAWEKLPARAKRLDLGVTFEEWQEAVIAEAKNRQFINRAYTGSRRGGSLRSSIKTVISEIPETVRELEKENAVNA